MCIEVTCQLFPFVSSFIYLCIHATFRAKMAKEQTILLFFRFFPKQVTQVIHVFVFSFLRNTTQYIFVRKYRNSSILDQCWGDSRASNHGSHSIYPQKLYFFSSKKPLHVPIRLDRFLAYVYQHETYNNLITTGLRNQKRRRQKNVTHFFAFNE